DAVEQVLVRLVVEERVLQERERCAVRRRELAEEEVAASEQPLEEVEAAAQLLGELRDRSCIRLGATQLRLERVRRSLPDPVEPVQEDVQLRPARRLARKELRLGRELLEVAQDRGRVRHE